MIVYVRQILEHFLNQSIDIIGFVVRISRAPVRH